MHVNSLHGRLQVGGRGAAAPVTSPCPPAAPPHLWLNEFVVPHDEMN